MKRLLTVLLSVLGAPCAGDAAQTPAPPRDLTRLSIEELTNVEVTSVAKKGQKLSQAATAVYVLTQEDIRRSGATSIPEALRMVPGLQVARIDASKWAVTARGFNGQFSSKMLVLIDGRSVYTPLFSGVYWDLQDTLLEDIDRIEVIRGPGATMWGANAVNGVINIITRHARDTQGGFVSGGAGSEERGFGGVRYGGSAGPHAWWRFYSKYFQRDHQKTAEGRYATDDWHALRGGFRLDWEVSDRDSLTTQADVYGGRAGQTLSTFSLQPPFARVLDDQVRSSGGNALARWTRRFSDTSDLTLQFYYDRTDRRDATIGEIRDTLDFDLHHRFALAGRNDILWGFGHRFTRDRTVASTFGSVEPGRRGDNLASAFLQDELLVVEDRLRLTFGSKFEHNDYTGFEVQPNARLLWTPHPRHSAWAGISRAVRTPSRGEHDGRFNFAAIPGPGGLPLLVTVDGDHGVGSEDLRAHELGYRVQPSHTLSIDAATFYNVYDNLVTARLGAPFLARSPSPHLVVPARIVSGGGGRSYGLELAANWNPAERCRFAGGYTGFRLRLVPAPGTAPVTTSASARSPNHQLHARSYLDLTPTLQLDTALYYVGAMAGIGVPSYHRLDTRLGWRPTAELDLSLGLQNLLDSRHPEFLAETLTQRTEIGRSVYGKVTWRF